MPLAPLAWITGFRRVPDNSVVTVHRFGRFIRALGPGWRWTLPGLDQLGQPVCLIGHHLSVVGAGGAEAELYYQILDPALAGEDLDDADALVIRESLVVLDDPVGADTLKTALNQRLAPKGLRVTRCRLV
jgi:regulator of protease activity HflC (stomatin/prohibitin superfamily)